VSIIKEEGFIKNSIGEIFFIKPSKRKKLNRTKKGGFNYVKERKRLYIN
jgi:hypothetical protein